LVGNIYLLVGVRAAQAVGGAGFTPSATGIVVDHFGTARDKALGLFGSIFPIGAAIGPILGGVLIAAWSWRGIFLVNVPIGTLLVALSFRYVPRYVVDRGRRAGRVDLTGVALLGVGVLASMIGTVRLGDAGGVYSASFAAPEAVAVLMLGLFVRHIRRHADPLISLRLLAGRGFGAVNLINFLYGGAVTGLASLVPLYATERYGLSALASGTLLTGRGAAVIVLSSLAVVFLRRSGYRRPMFVGFILIAAGMLALTVSPLGVPAYAWLAAAAALTGIGAGWSNPATRNASLQLAPQESASIAALRSVSRRLGMIASVTVTTALLAQTGHPAHAMAYIFAVFALVLLAVVPFVVRVPEHRGAW
jgi:MFS family permease